MIQASVPPHTSLLAYFLGLIAVGTGLLLLPGAWNGPQALHPIDALFTAASAACVTGLAVVDTADFSRFGQVVILCLIQAGGLGIITFSTLFLMLRGGRGMPFRMRYFVQSYSLPIVEHDPARMSLGIVLFALAAECAGAFALYRYFDGRVADPLFASVFHAISAFCNAGFSTFRTSLEAHRGSPYLLLVMSALIVTGGLGFVVFVDIARRASGSRRRLTLHSRIVLLATGILILGAAALYYLMEAGSTLAGMGRCEQLANALFQAVTPRTAGFNTLPQARLSESSQVLTLFLMFVGGSPGSTAGGIKTSTAFLVVLQVLRARDRRGEIAFLHRKVSSDVLSDALLFAVKALLLLCAVAFLLLLFEAGSGKGVMELIFESVSAFGTVGLSLGVTPRLSHAGKLVIVGTMFFGRVGIVSMAARDRRPRAARVVDYAKGEVLIG